MFRTQNLGGNESKSLGQSMIYWDYIPVNRQKFMHNEICLIGNVGWQYFTVLYVFSLVTSNPRSDRPSSAQKDTGSSDWNCKRTNEFDLGNEWCTRKNDDVNST